MDKDKDRKINLAALASLGVINVFSGQLPPPTANDILASVNARSNSIESRLEDSLFQQGQEKPKVVTEAKLKNDHPQVPFAVAFYFPDQDSVSIHLDIKGKDVADSFMGSGVGEICREAREKGARLVRIVDIGRLSNVSGISYDPNNLLDLVKINNFALSDAKSQFLNEKKGNFISDNGIDWKLLDKGCLGEEIPPDSVILESKTTKIEIPEKRSVIQIACTGVFLGALGILSLRALRTKKS